MNIIDRIRDYLLNPRTPAVCLLLCIFLCETVSGQEDANQTLSAAERPAVAAVLDVPRDTPADAMESVMTLIDLNAWEVATEIFEPIAAEEHSPEELAAIVQRLGTARMLSLAGAAGEKQIPGARVFAQKCLAAAKQLAQSPENLRELIEELDSDSSAARQAARHDLASIGSPAAVACLQSLAEATDIEARTHLLLALTEMRPLVNPLVVAALADGKGQFRRDVAELAGHLRLMEAVPWLATLAAGGDENPEVVAAAQGALIKLELSLPNQNDALAVVNRAIERLDAGIPTDAITRDTDLWWTYDPEKQVISSRECSPAVLDSLAHTRLSQNYLVLSSATEENRQLAILSAIETAHLLGQAPPQEIIELAQRLSDEGLNSALSTAMQTNRGAAAVAICKLLGERGNLAALTSYDGLPTPLARAVNDPNPEVQFAALGAIMKIYPQQSFAGASAVPKALWRFASRAGTPQAVAGAPVAAHAQDWAGGLRGLGYDAIPVFTGIDVVQKALASPRLELVLVDSDIGKPLVREVIYQLRTHSQLAHVPVAVLTGNEDKALGAELAEVDDHLLAVSRPHGAPAMKSVVDRLKALADNQYTAEARTKQATQALEWLAQLLSKGSPYDELLRHADTLERTVFRKELSQASLSALAAAGTAGSQETLANFASLRSQSIELRRLAATAFADSIERFGCLLTADQIATQYDRYNASETADAETQQVLSEVLDAIEKKTKE